MAEPPKKYPRKLPMGDARQLVDVPSLGRFHAQSVGSTAYTTGLDIRFHRHGAEEADQGYIRFACKIDAGYNVVWKIVPVGYPAGLVQPFSEAVVGWANQVAETTKTRDPIGWMFHVQDAIAMELEKRRRDKKDLERGIEQLTELLQDSSEPKTTFVLYTPEELKLRKDHKKGYFIPSTAEDRAQRRMDWQVRLERYTIKLKEYCETYDARLERLQETREAIHRWSRDGRSRRHEHRVVEVALAALKKESVNA